MCKRDAFALIVPAATTGRTTITTTTKSQVNPGMLAYAHIYQEQHNYSRHPFVPIGMESLEHLKPNKQRTYSQHCKKGYVIGTLFKHYRCQTIWMKGTNSTCVLRAVWFKHKYLTNPAVTPED